RKARFEAAYRRARSYVLDMENSNHMIEQEAMGSMREAIDRLGRALVAAGALDAADDVLHLSLADLRSEPAVDRDLRPRVAERRATRDQAARLTPPRVLGAPAARGDPPAEPAPADGIVRG